MTKRTMRIEATKQEKPAGTGFDPSTWGGQARLLAHNDADAAAALTAAGLAVADAVIIGAALWLELASWRDVLAPGLLAVLGTQAAAVGLTWLVTYARALRSDTRQVRWTTWRQEQQAGEDLDGDGYVGDPTRGIRVRVGDQVEEIEVDLPARSAMGAPVIPAWGVSAPDLVAILFEADLVRGLQERAWVGKDVTPFTLPSGGRVTQSMFRQVLGELAERGWAVKVASRWELAILPEQVAAALKAGTPPPAGGARGGAFSQESAQHAHAQHARVNGAEVKA